MSKATIAALQHNLTRALKLGQLEEATEILGRLKQESPLSKETRGFELELMLRTSRLDEAEALSSQLLRLFPNSARIQFLCGRLSYRLKHYPQAEGCFRESHRLYPSLQTQLWLGKTLTQRGAWDEAESFLLAARDHYRLAHLELGWLYERKGDLVEALKSYETHLESHPGDEFALQQQLRVKAKMLDPEELVSEVETLSDIGEPAPDAVFPEYVATLFQTGNSQRARQEVQQRLGQVEPRLGMQLAWVCHHAQAFDLSCTLFLQFVEGNLSNFKYLVALESAAGKCNRVEEVVAAYRALASAHPKLHGRIKALSRRMRQRR
jgi:tetratricopeptide (TPR) repeat protein